jgi:hypothetical protein
MNYQQLISMLNGEVGTRLTGFEIREVENVPIRPRLDLNRYPPFTFFNSLLLIFAFLGRSLILIFAMIFLLSSGHTFKLINLIIILTGQ